MTPFCSRSTFVRAAGKFGNLDINCDRFARIASFRPPRPRRVPCSTRCPCMHWMLVGACNRMLSPIHAIRRRMLGTPHACLVLPRRRMLPQVLACRQVFLTWAWPNLVFRICRLHATPSISHAPSAPSRTRHARLCCSVTGCRELPTKRRKSPHLFSY